MMPDDPFQQIQMPVEVTRFSINLNTIDGGPGMCQVHLMLGTVIGELHFFLQPSEAIKMAEMIEAEAHAAAIRGRELWTPNP